MIAPKENIREHAISLIKKYMGDNTANVYREFYKDKDDETILSSLHELLDEFLGDSKLATQFV